ncbi:MAG: hypothetical protein ACQEXG_09840 [Pseudomonadota bacterium]
MTHDGTVDSQHTAPPLHRFSEESSAQQVTSSWPLINELEHLPNSSSAPAVQAPGPAPHHVAAPAASPAEPTTASTSPAPSPAITPPDPAPDEHHFGHLFNGYGDTPAPEHSVDETPLKPLLRAISQQGGT